MSYDEIWKKPEPHYKSEFPEEVLNLFKKSKAKRILDLGSGDGTNMILLAKENFETFGLEISSTGVEKTKEMASQTNVNVNIQQGDIYQSLPFSEKYFDAVIGLQSLNHNTLPEILKLFKEIYRVLKKKGLFCIKIADRESYNLKKIENNIYMDTDYNEKFKFLDEQTYLSIEGKEKGIIHYAFYKKQLEGLVIRTGFELLSSERLKWHILAIFKKKNK